MNISGPLLVSATSPRVQTHKSAASKASTNTSEVAPVYEEIRDWVPPSSLPNEYSLKGRRNPQSRGTASVSSSMDGEYSLKGRYNLQSRGTASVSSLCGTGTDSDTGDMDEYVDMGKYQITKCDSREQDGELSYVVGVYLCGWWSFYVCVCGRGKWMGPGSWEAQGGGRGAGRPSEGGEWRGPGSWEAWGGGEGELAGRPREGEWRGPGSWEAWGGGEGELGERISTFHL